jgi:hypothetical protein
MAEQNRLARELGTRDTAQRKQTWAPAQTLPSPNPIPGWTFRWIRTSMMGQNDPTNMSAKFREGWEAVRAEDHPELQYIADPSSKFKDNVEIGGLLLCKAPTEMVQQRAEWYASQARSQEESVDNSFMRQNDQRMPLFAEKKSGVTFGRGTK